MSLPKQFDQLRDTLRYEKDTVTMDEVMNSIHSKKLEFSVNGKDSKNPREVMYSNSSSRGRSIKRDSGQSKSKDKHRSKSKGKGNCPTCWVCGEVGHFKRNCPKRSNNKGKEKSLEPSESSAVIRVNYIESLVVTEANAISTIDFNDIWILDTCCTFHMTPRKDWFTELNESSGDSVRMANNSLSSVEGIAR